ncbi:hypothetical protein P4V37_05085 [Bacillus subtilis]|uniref:hypothetical protein n=1 Tax=Bacillus subtilis TaxID=1423 RepID=UPI000D70408E|nr:hypothetical protein [Bacillus subtilis]MED1980007.1 hypothetical protein [Bacillus subtilis]MED1992066.1 hypothetical protein [Bacillus subtilis]PWT21927.1 hypothetical protein DLD52_01565 [Bacillus subtilis]QPG33229.1 hypothetical protein ITP52_21990 [Bacillus subtilis]ULN54915.1 hypothetical protein MID01_11295 [Bacillus subtilis]
MAKTIKDIKAMVEQAAIQSIHKSSSNVKQIMVKTGQEHIDEDVYGAYDPLLYERTGKLKDAFITTNESNGVSLDNIREDDGKDVATVIETGHGYTYPDSYGYGYGKPRPVMKNTAETLKDGRLTEAVKRDLKADGIKTY